MRLLELLRLALSEDVAMKVCDVQLLTVTCFRYLQYLF
jgi:hypothetical protein